MNPNLQVDDVACQRLQKVKRKMKKKPTASVVDKKVEHQPSAAQSLSLEEELRAEHLPTNLPIRWFAGDMQIRKPYAFQVAGHDAVLKLNGGKICKPLFLRELWFYSSCEADTRYFLPFLPKFQGCVIFTKSELKALQTFYERKTSCSYDGELDPQSQTSNHSSITTESNNPSLVEKNALSSSSSSSSSCAASPSVEFGSSAVAAEDKELKDWNPWGVSMHKALQLQLEEIEEPLYRISYSYHHDHLRIYSQFSHIRLYTHLLSSTH